MADGPSFLERMFELSGGAPSLKKLNLPSPPPSPKRQGSMSPPPSPKRQGSMSPPQSQKMKKTIQTVNNSPPVKPKDSQHHAHPPHESKPTKADVGTDKEKEDDIAAIIGGLGATETAYKFKKIGFIMLIFVLTLMLSCVIMFSPIVYNTFFKEDDPDANFESPDATHKSRYKKIALILFVYTLVVIASFICCMIIIFLFVFLIKPENGVSAWEYFETMLLSYTIEGTSHSLSYIYMIMLAILIITYLVYIIYFAFVKDYFLNLTYPSYLPEDSEKTEFTQPQKFIIFYGIMMLYVFTFIIFVINYLEYESTTIFFAVTFIVFIMMVIVGKFYQKVLEKNLFSGVIWFVFMCIVPLSGVLLPKLANTNMSVSMPKTGLAKFAFITLFVIILILTILIYFRAVNEDSDEKTTT